MIHIDGLLYLEHGELVPNVIPEGTYNTMRARGKFSVYGRGGNGSAVLIDYESLPEGYKEKVKAYYGDPYEYASKQPILDSIEPNPEAERFFLDFMLPNGAKLPNSDKDVDGKTRINYVKRYKENAEWLDMLVRMTLDKRTLKKELNISLAAFWESAAYLIKTRKVSLPGNARRLKDKTKQYKNEGYECLVETHKFGNNHSEKVSDEEARAVLLKLLCHKNNFDDTFIASRYND